MVDVPPHESLAELRRVSDIGGQGLEFHVLRAGSGMLRAEVTAEGIQGHPEGFWDLLLVTLQDLLEEMVGAVGLVHLSQFCSEDWKLPLKHEIHAGLRIS